MGAQPKFKRTLQPFAQCYSNFLESVRGPIREMDEATLQDVLDATKFPSETNCWWATYNVAPIVRNEVNLELLMRARLAEVTR